jgi:hypothetical protein
MGDLMAFFANAVTVATGLALAYRLLRRHKEQ